MNKAIINLLLYLSKSYVTINKKGMLKKKRM